MKKTAVKIIWIVFISGLFIIPSCAKFEEYPIIPHIEFVSFSTIHNVHQLDSLGYLTISYTDGDGDIGLTNEENTPPYQYNFFLDIYENINGVQQKIIFPDTSITFNSRIPVLTPDGVNKSIKGEIRMELELYIMSPFLNSDTISFETYIMDRALNKSNVIHTPEFIIR
ncbi:MAG: hypothetical protein K8R41_09655 [Bacteroidales bacterium]|nr:hypothetical protein [Bacteroidales bacterium]